MHDWITIRQMGGCNMAAKSRKAICAQTELIYSGSHFLQVWPRKYVEWASKAPWVINPIRKTTWYEDENVPLQFQESHCDSGSEILEIKRHLSRITILYLQSTFHNKIQRNIWIKYQSRRKGTRWRAACKQIKKINRKQTIKAKLAVTGCLVSAYCSAAQKLVKADGQQKCDILTFT